MKEINFKILNINRHRLGTDGKGITTLVALSTCPLNCIYCINKKIISNNKYKEFTKEELLEKIMQDYCYFLATGGGVTFGGAEPLLQSKQILEFSKLLPPGVSLNIETSLNVDFNTLNIYFLDILKCVNKFYIDIKNTNPDIYKKYTGKDNLLVIKNLKFITDNNYQDKCVIRIPNIPNFTSKEDIDKSINYIKDMGFTELDVFNYIIKKR